MSHIEHKKLAKKNLRIAILTVSDTRILETDESGKLIKKKLEDKKHKIIDYKICKDDPKKIIEIINAYKNIDAIIINGGTGIAKRDNTYEAVSKIMTKTIPGFGEIFRLLSYKEIGASAILSRAQAGTYKNFILISIPGSTRACKLALDKIIIPELPHMVYELRK
jgi:molybdenum cofactor biosynthesis protein B